MIIENSRAVIRSRLQTFSFTLVVVTLIVIIYTTRIFLNPVWGLNKTHWTLIVVGLYLLILLQKWLRNIYYFYFSDTGTNLIFRFYPLQFFSAKKQSFEIPKRDFVKFEIKSSFLKMKKSLIVYQKLRKGVAKYPAISISGLSRQDKTKLKSQLEKYSVSK